MKAEIISQTVYEGVLAWTHGSGSTIKRIFIPEANNLVITPHENNLFIWDNFQKDDCEIVKEIEIPDELVEKAIGLMESRKSLLKEFRKFIR
ncbi:MAG: hypothetical protein A2V72_01025 [Candidatus Nealsonbacteria bacterium RBG_13_37_56]|uniref:Uncharacterized protein n=1 Tax=Candidatus Nealsonbacteria bacterium RBG_13_37_56 TaxID=1801661 RepID=A0A1G2DXG4_9BACT|nr:MAG: hypothetical protein A2V72_01025 [Candidatus Nealsonbacteria bacterium RBG_13_37_56]